MVSSTRENEAGAALRLSLDTDVEPNRAVEAGLLVEQQVGELVGEDHRVGRGSRSSLGRRPTSGSSRRRDRSAGGRSSRAAGCRVDRGSTSRRRRWSRACVHAFGISTSCCSNTTSPFSPVDDRAPALPLDVREGIEAGLREVPLRGEPSPPLAAHPLDSGTLENGLGEDRHFRLRAPLQTTAHRLLPTAAPFSMATPSFFVGSDLARSVS